ncbi:AAA family ATPase [Hassallia byssoidea VB512170]|uniref:AAA family ATPase n=1 Tax=Hassallia byssoidea VB512170 TaxID=1304833 RepID=A0A846HG97_9CYAN|nr:AAA family ATPase [Hassalia byssoidea]NEU75674.1 AAA family ATPase [Hassalia byssoidea VB512170]
MTSDYASTLGNIFQAIAPHSSESDVEQKVIVPLLLMLGYSHTDWEPQAIVGKSKLDFLVLPPTSAIPYAPYLVIEAKAPNKNIAQNVWQINKYMRQTAAILGLLTNGYQFCLLYNYNQNPTTILDYSQKELINNYKLINQVLCKETSLKLYQKFYHNEKQIRLKFISLISQLFANEDMFQSFTKTNNSDNESKKTFASVRKLEETPLVTETQKERQAMIITVFNNKGGVGKTTTTINLAAALNKLGKRVLLIDIDAQANLTMGLGIDPLEDVERHGKKDITHLLTEPRISLEETIIRKTWDDVELDIVPSHIRLSYMEATLINTLDIDRVLAKKLKKYRDQYDYILIDPPPSFGKANTISLMASSAVLIPTHLSPYPIRALEYVINRAIAVDQSRDEKLPILGIAVSMYNRAATKVALSMTQQIFDIISKNPESKNVDLFPQDTWIPNLTIVSSTPNKGYPICFAEFDNELSSKDKETAQDAFNCYMKLAKHLIFVTKEKQ